MLGEKMLRCVFALLAVACVVAQAQMEMEWVEEDSKSPKLANPRVINKVEFPPVPPKFWSADGDCVDNPTYSEDCKVWAEKGYCSDDSLNKHYPKWMQRHCRASCGFCRTEAGSLWNFALKLLAAAVFYAWIFGVFPAILPRPRWVSLLMSTRKHARTIILVAGTAVIYFV